MKTIYLITLLLLATSLFSQSQLVNQVFAVSGIDGQVGSTLISSTVGQPVIGTLSDGSNFLTQGFQQNFGPLSTSTWDQLELQTNVTVFPNPTIGPFRLTIDQPLYNVRYEVRNLYGHLVNHVRISDDHFDLRDVPTGMYFVTITADEGFKTIKLQIIK